MAALSGLRSGSAAKQHESENPLPLSIDYRSTDEDGVIWYEVSSPHNGRGTHVLRVLTPAKPATGVPHNFLYALPVEPELGTMYGDGLKTLRDLGAQDRYNLTIVMPSFAVDPWYADNPHDPSLRYESFMTKDLVPWVRRNFELTGDEQNWLIGFSKSGFGATDLLLRNPYVFALAASFDFPARMASYKRFNSSSAGAYGTNANFRANYRLTRGFVETRKAPFLAKNRIWIGGGETYPRDVDDYDALLTSMGIPHTTAMSQPILHTWNDEWVEGALHALSLQGADLGGTQDVARTSSRAFASHPGID